MLPPDSLSTCLNDLPVALDYKINIVAVTEHPVGKLKSLDEQETVSVYDSIYNSEDDLSTDSYDDGIAPKSNRIRSKEFMNKMNKSADSGRRTLSSTYNDDDDEVANFISNLKSLREIDNQLSKYPTCKPGPILWVNYNNLVVPPDGMDVTEVLGQNAKLAWNFTVPKNLRNERGMVLVRPEVFNVRCWIHGESMSTAKVKETKGSFSRL